MPTLEADAPPKAKRQPTTRKLHSVVMDDLSALAASAKRIAKFRAQADAELLIRDSIIVEARLDNFQWGRIAEAAQLTILATEKAATRANGGKKPKPKHR